MKRLRQARLALWVALLVAVPACVTTARPTYIYSFRPAQASTGALDIKMIYDGSVHKQRTIFSPQERLLMFEIQLKNKTERVIRTSGCKMIFDYRGKPYRALSKVEMLQWLRDTKNPSQRVYQSVAGRKLFNEGMEILPGYSTSAYVCFPVSPDLAVDGKIKIFDFPQAVREDGSVKSKTNLTFEVTRTGA